MIVVTGGAGFIGSAFIAKLNSEGVRDIIIVDEVASPQAQHNLQNKAYREFVSKDTFVSRAETNTLPATISAIVHMGACSSTTEKDLEFLARNNFEYTKTLAKYAIARGLRFIYASSAATYGDGSSGYSDDHAILDSLQPLNPYGNSKHLFDVWARNNGYLTSIVGLKFFNVYGPNEYYKGDMASVVWKAFTTIQETGSFSLFKSNDPQYGDGEQKRDFVYVKDCCEVMWWLLQSPSVSGIYNVGSGRARSWNDLLRAVFKAMGKPCAIHYIDMPSSIRAQYQNFTEAPMEKLRSVGYTDPFFTLEEGVRDYITQHLLAPNKHW